jgi:hypothetical protein
MEPLTPIKDPTVVNNGLSSMNPTNRTPSHEHNVRTKKKQTFRDKSKSRVCV